MQSGLSGQDGSHCHSPWALSHPAAGVPEGKVQPGGQVVQLTVNAASNALGHSLSEALEGFFRDGVASEQGLGPNPPANTTSAMHKVATDDDFTQLFQLDGPLNLESLPNDFFQGDDVSELLGGAFEDLISPESAFHLSEPHPGDQQHDLQQIANTARSVLETLGGDEPSPGTSGSVQGSAPAPASAPDPNPSPHVHPPPPLPSPRQYQHQPQPQPGTTSAPPSPPMEHQHESLLDLLNSPMEEDEGAGAGAPALAGTGPSGAAPAPMAVQYQVMPSGPLLMDARTGQLMVPPASIAGGLPTYHAWSSSALQLAHGGQLVPIQGQPLYTSTGQPVQIIMPAQQHQDMGAGPVLIKSQPVVMQYQGMPSQGLAGLGGAVQAPRRPPAKRKSQVLPEVASDRSARLAQGFSYDPVSGRALRHGPALAAAAIHDKELPAVTALFSTFAQRPFDNKPPPPGYAQQVAQQVRSTSVLPPQAQYPQPQHQGSGGGGSVMGLRDCSGAYGAPHGPHAVHGGVVIQHPGPLTTPPPQAQHAMLLQHQQAAAAAASAAARASGVVSQGSPYPGTDSYPALLPRQQLQQLQQRAAEAAGQSWGGAAPSQLSSDVPTPSGRQIHPQTGHGFIKSLVVRELQSNAPPAAPPAVPPAKEVARGLKGVSRDKWSLFWDAYVQPTSPVAGSSLLSGFKQEAIYLGKFPTQEQAGRAHDLAALKINGPDSETNFPASSYEKVMPILQAHSGEELVAAIHKDSHMAMRRTSKYKGVRRVGQGQFEARIETLPGPT